MKPEFPGICILPDRSIRDVIACIDRGRKGIALVTDKEGRLIDTITDGDVRRSFLAGKDLDAPIRDLLDTKMALPFSKPLTASIGTDPAELLRTMQEHGVRHMPLLDDEGRVVDLVMLDDLMPDQGAPLEAVIMAGGLGTRLRPLTENVPKPMLPVGDRPLLELILTQLREAGIRRINVTTHYKPEKIMAHFGDGKRFGIELNYVNEHQPLGTGGALGLMPKPKQPIIVMNGDILTELDFLAMLTYHKEHRAELTVAVTRYEIQVPYGVIECEGSTVSRLLEKPQVGFFVNAGIYLLEPVVYQLIPRGKSFNMTDLIQWMMDDGRPVVSFPIREYWLDIGRHGDYLKAQTDIQEGKVRVDS